MAMINQTQQKPEIIITRGHEQPPLVFGPVRLHYQYSVTLPQIHLTLVGVLQGIAFGVLLLAVPLPTNTSWPAIFYYLLAHYLYLPFVISSLGIIFIWMQFVEVSMFLFWPLSPLQAILVFLLTMCEIIAFREVNTFPAWLAGAGTVGIIGGWITLRNLKLNTKEIYESRLGSQMSFQSFFQANQYTGKLYIVLGTITIIIGLAFTWVSGLVGSIVQQIISLVPWIILLFLLVSLLTILKMDRDQRKRWLDEVTKDSDLTVSPYGVLHYDTQKEESGTQHDTQKEEFEEPDKQLSPTLFQPLHYKNMTQLVLFSLLNAGLVSFLVWLIHRISTRQARNH